MTHRTETIGPCTLYLGDCLDVLPTLGKVDAVVTDPPYGLGEKWNSTSWATVKGKRGVRGSHGNTGRSNLWVGGTPDWDREPAWREVSAYLGVGSQHVIFGGNYFWLPPTNAWLIWDKNQEHSGSHCEMAWTDLNQPIRKFTLSRVEAYCSSGPKEHPNQKPLVLMSWCVRFTSGIVCDPMMGSGTTGVACIRTGRKFIGIEKHEPYFEIACQRIRRAWQEKQSELVFEPEPTFEQQSLMEVS